MRNMPPVVRHVMAAVVNVFALLVSWFLVLVAFGVAETLAGPTVGLAVAVAAAVVLVFAVWLEDAVTMAEWVARRLPKRHTAKRAAGSPQPAAVASTRTTTRPATV